MLLEKKELVLEEKELLASAGTCSGQIFDVTSLFLRKGLFTAAKTHCSSMIFHLFSATLTKPAYM